MRLMQVKMLTV